MVDESTTDVVILGSGISGTMLAALLARHGVSVLILESGTHPRFAVGESTIPHTSLLLSLLAARHDVPELDYLAYPDLIQRHVGSTCGIKRSFGFAFHREGEPHDPCEGLQFGTSSKDENHLFRQDVDAYLLHVAIRYGARYRDRVTVAPESIRFDAAGVGLALENGEELRCRYLVDATGRRSPVAEVLRLRDEPTRLRHHSRSLFTHVVGMRPFQEEESPFALPWEESTLHHVFDGGWFWVIPFGNRPESTNPLTSVGLTLDPRRHPSGSDLPEEEFRRFLRRFPSVEEQFRDARPVRSWVSTGRTQFSSRRSTGARYCLMSHAAGFVDPLFSRGLINTIEVVYALVDPLLEALRDDDFTDERFEAIDGLQARVLGYNDKLVNGAFQSWSDFGLWNAWARVWALGTILTEFRLMKVLEEYTTSGDPGCLETRLSDPAFSDFEDPDYASYFRRAVRVMAELEAGKLDASSAAARILEAAADYEFPVMLSSAALQRAGWIQDGQVISERNIGFARRGYRWALTNPTTRDLFGNTETLYRWRAQHPDPHLVGEA